MKKTILIILILFLTLIGCNRKKQLAEIGIKPKIEIYLPVERIISKDGSEFQLDMFYVKETQRDSFLNIEHNKELFTYARIDTISKKNIYAGSYEANEDDLPVNPFIYDNEILGFDFKMSEINLSASAVEKLWNLQPNFNYSRQFVLTYDRKPILTGYFFSALSSSYVKHFYIVYDNGYEGLEKPEFKNEKFRIEYNPESEYTWDLEKYDFKQNKEFYEAFKVSGKIAQ